VTGLAIVILSILGFADVFALASPLDYCLNAFMLTFGLLLFVVEGPEDWDWIGFRSSIFDYFGFMRHPVGRAIFYLFVGVFQFCSNSILGYVLGGCLCFCAVVQPYVVIRDHYSETTPLVGWQQ